jgi:hypothetical protein
MDSDIGDEECASCKIPTQTNAPSRLPSRRKRQNFGALSHQFATERTHHSEDTRTQ